MNTEVKDGVYGAPPVELAATERDAIQYSPLIPGSATLEEVAPGSLARITVLAPPGTVERKYVLALALRALKPEGELVALALKTRGGARLRSELEAFGCVVAESSKRHHRICVTRRADVPLSLEQAITEGGPRRIDHLGWTQPGVFSWDRLDPGSELLIEALPDPTGEGADLGCGIGLLARRVLVSAKVTRLRLVDIDRRAVTCAQANVDDPRASFHWMDVRKLPAEPKLDFVAMNPPFHDGGSEDKALGQAFIAAAASMLRSGGVCWLVANRHLPYEAALAEHFAKVRLLAQTGGYKVYEARR